MHGPRIESRAGAAALLLAALPVAQQSPSGGDELLYAARVRPFLAAHCARCHGGDEPRADLDLDAFPDVASVAGAPDTWDLLRELLAYGEMPPTGEPRPPEVEVDAVLAWIDDAIGPPVAQGPIDPGPAPIRRLSRTEYRNSVRDLLGVEFPVEEFFPPDALGHGFDTSAEAQTIPTLLLERYVEAAERIAAEAVAVDDTDAPSVRRLDGPALRGPNQYGGAVGLHTVGEAWADVELPRAGRYALRARVWADNAGPELARVELRAQWDEQRDEQWGELRDGLATFEVREGRGSAEELEVECELPRGTVRVAAAFLNDYYRPDAPEPGERDRNLYVDWLEVIGPLDRPVPTPFQTELCARFGPELGAQRLLRMLEHVALRAWRRPPAASELRRLLTLTEPDQALEERLRDALAGVLASSSFLFRIEPDPPPESAVAVRALDAWELASRLSYFLWNTLPDEGLLALARSGRLVEEEVLLAEVERMLADPRSRAFSESFAEQWLQVRRLSAATPDPELFPGFDDALRASMRAESVGFFDAVLRGSESVWELLEADWTVVDARLAEHYGLPPLAQEGVQRVPLTHTPRRGVLGQASVLTATSHATRTSPVVRGKWILEVLLGSAPPPPPPGAGSLSDEDAENPELSFREKLALHRADPSCAACHATMDPLGFGLERFDAIGRVREQDGGRAVDTHGVLPDGRAFDGPVELAAILRADGRFVRTLTEKVLVYALGRGLTRADRRTVDAILEALHRERPTLAQIVREVVRSDAFRRRRGDTRATREERGVSPEEAPGER